MTELAVTALVMLCFLPYHVALFSCYSLQTAVRPPAWLGYGLISVGNYATFILISFWKWPLSVNWLFIAVLLTAEVRLLYRATTLQSAFLGLSGALAGLATSVVARSASAILLDKPLAAFNAGISIDDMFTRSFSVGAGFVLAGAFLLAVRRVLKHQAGRNLKRSPSNLKFSLALLAVLYACLVLNLLLYSLSSNALILKLWGLKTGVCALISYCIGVWYAIHESNLEHFASRTDILRNSLVSSGRQEKILAAQAYTDYLTGCASRLYGEQALAERFRRGEGLAVCFLDLNGLKEVNDCLGHAQGDRYIVAVAQALADVLPDERDLVCRYGGDEFLVVLSDRSADAAADLMKNVNSTLNELSWSAPYPFHLSVSYGIAMETEGNTFKDVLAIADKRMYELKESMRAGRGQGEQSGKAG